MTPLGFTVFNLANRNDTFRVYYVSNPASTNGDITFWVYTLLNGESQDKVYCV